MIELGPRETFLMRYFIMGGHSVVVHDLDSVVACGEQACQRRRFNRHIGSDRAGKPQSTASGP
jgi:hypothetical protein